MCLNNLVFLPPLNFSPPNFHENMHDFRPPSFFQGRRLRPCFSGVDAPGIAKSSFISLLSTLYLFLRFIVSCTLLKNKLIDWLRNVSQVHRVG